LSKEVEGRRGLSVFSLVAGGGGEGGRHGGASGDGVSSNQVTKVSTLTQAKALRYVL
jgi:hypothetical protein